MGKDITDFVDSLKPSTNWVEISMIVLLVVGLFVSLLMKDAMTSYVVIFLIGIISGRTVYKKLNSLQSYLLIFAGFVVGYILGVRYGSVFLNIIFFILGNAVSFMLHKKQIID